MHHKKHCSVGVSVVLKSTEHIYMKHNILGLHELSLSFLWSPPDAIFPPATRLRRFPTISVNLHFNSLPGINLQPLSDWHIQGILNLNSVLWLMNPRKGLKRGHGRRRWCGTAATCRVVIWAPAQEPGFTHDHSTDCPLSFKESVLTCDQGLGAAGSANRGRSVTACAPFLPTMLYSAQEEEKRGIREIIQAEKYKQQFSLIFGLFETFAQISAVFMSCWEKWNNFWTCSYIVVNTKVVTTMKCDE